jgi:KaiC/GvpD/RAD55 family RecA-like ATPase
MRQVEDAATKARLTVDDFVSNVLYAHFQAEYDKSLPSLKEIILGNIHKVPVGATFTVIDTMDSAHIRDPKQRRNYGHVLALLIVRRTIHAEYTGVHKGTYKVYRKL